MRKLTRETLPAFMSHRAARRWMREHLDGEVVLNRVEEAEPEKVYCYHWIKNKPAYIREIEAYKNWGANLSDEFWNSFEPFEVTEGGRFRFYER